MRKDLFDILEAFKEKNNLNNLDKEAKRFVEQSIIEGRQYGNLLKFLFY